MKYLLCAQHLQIQYPFCHKSYFSGHQELSFSVILTLLLELFPRKDCRIENVQQQILGECDRKYLKTNQDDLRKPGQRTSLWAKGNCPLPSTSPRDCSLMGLRVFSEWIERRELFQVLYSHCPVWCPSLAQLTENTCPAAHHPVILCQDPKGLWLALVWSWCALKW